jgi:hypothetical protein
MFSTNGVNWTPFSGPTGAWTGLTFGAGRFVGVSSLGQLITSTDGLHWAQTWVHSKFHFTSVAYGNGRFIAVDDAQGDVLISLNGIGWSFYPIAWAGQKWGAVTFENGNFVAFDESSGVVATTVLGYVWALHDYSPDQQIRAATFGCDSFVATGQSTGSANNFISSHLGATWSVSVPPTTAASDWTSLAYGAFRFVAVDSAGNIASLHVAANYSATPPSAPQQVSGNIHNGEVWNYQHPPASPGGAPVDGYGVTITDGVRTWQCHAPVYFEPNCIIKGLQNHQVYRVTAQAHNRFGYSVPSDPQFVIAVASWSLSALVTPPVVSSSTPVVMQVTGILANGEGIYPDSDVMVHFGARNFYCQPSPFGECLITAPSPSVGFTSIYATYTGYGRSYRSPTSHAAVAAVTFSSSNVAAKRAITVTVRGGVSQSIARAYLGGKNFQTHLDRAGSGAIRVFAPTTRGTYLLTVQDAGVSLKKLTVHVHA